MGLLNTIQSKFEAKLGGTLQNLPTAVENIVYKMYLQDGLTVIQIPINPESIKVSRNGNFENYNILGIGDVVRPKTPQLRTWSWSGLLMMDYFDPLNSSPIVFPPMVYVKFFERLQESKKPFKFMQNTVSFVASFFNSANYKVIIERFDWEERGGEPGDIYYNITLREYKDFGLNYINIPDVIEELIPEETLAFNPDQTNPLQKITSEIVRDTGTDLAVDKKLSGFTGKLETLSIENGESYFYPSEKSWNNAEVQLISQKKIGDFTMWQIKNVGTGELGWASAETLNNFIN